MERRPRQGGAGAASTSAAWIEARLAEALFPAPVRLRDLDERAAGRLLRYVELILAWNRRINLTGARSAETLVQEHLADALPLLLHLPGQAFDFVDVGSGAGLPGIVVAILRPDARGVLLEPLSKKQVFLATAIRELGLSGVQSVRERLEEHLRRGARYDVAFSRATWSPAEWIARGRQLVRPGGLVLGLEGGANTPLPTGVVRYPYRCAGRERAVLALRVRGRESSAGPA